MIRYCLLINRNDAIFYRTKKQENMFKDKGFYHFLGFFLQIYKTVIRYRIRETTSETEVIQLGNKVAHLLINYFCYTNYI